MFLLVIDWTTSFSSVRHLTGLGMCVRQRNVIGISLSVVLSTVRWKVFYVWFYIDVHTSCIFIFFFSSYSKFYWILSQERMCKTTKYGIQYCLRVLVHVFVFKISQYCSVVFAADILAFIGCCRLLQCIFKAGNYEIISSSSNIFFPFY